MFKDFKKYARHRSPVAMEALGNFYMNGYGTEKNFGIKDPSKAIALYSQSALKIEAAAQKLTDLNIPLPKQPVQDDGIEHIEVTPLPFLELMELKVAGLRNSPVPGFQTSISPSCKIAKRDCGNADITDKSLILHLLRNNVRQTLK